MARILVIDDEVEVLLMLRQILELHKHQVVSAANGEKGAELFRDSPTDLIITDMIMPEKSGIETIVELVKEFPEVKIIAISGGGAIEPERYLSLAENLGAKQTLPKPFTHEELMNAVNDVLFN
ncbi:MAG: response regulator [Desulfobulbaceae bacterium]|nr:response regulator [Desulfobulbaceae bacterium]MCK5340304.1 response regulator [Desulfobulbaceae bacterium]